MRTLLLLLATCLFCASPVLAEDFRDLYREGKFSEALSALEASPEASEKSYSYYFNRGVIHHALNQAPLAVAYLEKARVMAPHSAEVREPLSAATANLVKWLGRAKLDPGSYFFESLGAQLPLDPLFLGFGILSLVSWFGFFAWKRIRTRFAQTGFISLLLAVLFGCWGTWLELHPQVVVIEPRLIKSGPGESFLDRGAVEPGMKLRVTGEMREEKLGAEGVSPRWWRVRFNEQAEEGFLPERSGLLLRDESNTPEA